MLRHIILPLAAVFCGASCCLNAAENDTLEKMFSNTYPSQRCLPNHINLRQLVVTEETEQGKVLQCVLILKIRDFSLPWFASTNKV